MKDNRYIAAIEISSSKVIGAVGRIDAEGKLHVVAVEQEKTIENVRYGIIQNMLDTNNTVNRVLRRLESRASITPRRIKSVYVGISGRSLCNIAHEVSRNLSEEVEITEDIIARLNDDARRADIDRSLKIIDVVPRTYYINNRETKSPIGSLGSKVQAKINLLVCREQLKRNVENLLRDKAMLGIDGIIVTPIATANMVLTDDDKRMGCMLVDMGAETTTVSIYKNGYLNYLATLPMGSRNITRDITSLGVVEEKAESIKISSGHATDGFVGHSLQIEGINGSDLAKIVVARCEEIVANITEQISYAGLTTEQLSGGIIIVGGGFRLNRLDDLLSKRSNQKVRNATLPTDIDLEDTKVQTYESIQVISLLLAAAKMNDNVSLEAPEPEVLPPTGEVNTDSIPEPQEAEQDKPRKPSRHSKLFEKIRSTMGKIFVPDEEEEEDEDLFN